MGLYENLPYTNYHELNADWIVKEVKRVAAEWVEYRDGLDTWKSGVDDQLATFQTWFDNLDLTDETRSIIQEMVSSGQFITVTQPTITSAVESWLADHVTGSNAIDDTLTISGAAADAKVTGDRIADLKEDLNNLQELTTDTTIITVTDWVAKHYVNTNNPIGAVITVPEKEVSLANFNYIILPVSNGDAFILSGTGGNDPRLYAWLDEDHKLLSNSAPGATVNNLELIASQKGYLVVNVNTNYEYSLQQRITVNIHSSTFVLTDFGVAGDGETDDTDAIQTALDVSEGHELFIPKGTYLFSKTLHIKSGTRVFGSGAESVFKQADTFTFDSYPWRTVDSLVKDHNRYPMIIIESTENGCMLENFKLEGQTTSFIDKNCDGLTLFGNNHVINNLVVKNIDFFPADFSNRTCDVPGFGICIMGSTITIKNCDVSECGYECVGTEDASVVTIEGCNVGFAVQTGVQVHRNSHSIRIINNRIRCYDGVSAYSPGLTIHAAQEYPMQDIFVDGNYIVSSFRIANGGGENDIRISNNYMVSIAVNAFAEQRDYRKNWIITGNTFTSGGIQAKCDGLIITNNIFNVNGSETVIHAKTNKYLIDNNLFAGTASEVIIEPH